ncbi:sigma-70 family RNA polymerase sigma factor [Catellatospora citrea]|uniref:sigma-70 family RNA polymerase sigma factor n=1 Tax=Catellatospora citrea TaxID=53366 RepID=UPI00340E62F4
MADTFVHRDSALQDPADADDETYPRLWNVSAAAMHPVVLRTTEPQPAEYVAIPLPSAGRRDLAAAVIQWNLLWEAAQYRQYMFDDGELPAEIAAVAAKGHHNVVFVPRTATRYYEYAPLFHLLPAATVVKHGMPLLPRGQWPHVSAPTAIERDLPDDFADRLSRAWADTVWRHLMPGSPQSGFTGNDPIRLLAHNLDYWIPAVTEVMQQILRTLPEIDNGVRSAPAELDDGTVLPAAVTANPRMGADLWHGQAEAADIVARTVEQADATGRLRDILDAVRSHRIEDDFSARWTYAREDFERKLHRKRNKIKVRFVELPDTIPVQGPESEIVDRHVFDDFLALLDERERQVVVLLRSGVTKLTDIAQIMGYAGHSSVSKKLVHIRDLADRHFTDR